MAFENIKAAIDTLMADIAERPGDRLVLQEQIREKIAEMRALGLPVPADLKQFEEELEDGENDIVLDNLPI
ncbi:MAG TPA: hypothetical protein ENK63_05260 [Rhodobacterales bacterium]|nr:hypothetical protein [Rhodobacterales bacterium]